MSKTETQLEIENQVKTWCKARMLPFDPKYLHHPVSFEEYSSVPKVEGMKFSYVDDKKETIYGFYIPKVDAPKEDNTQKATIISNIELPPHPSQLSNFDQLLLQLKNNPELLQKFYDMVDGKPISNKPPKQKGRPKKNANT